MLSEDLYRYLWDGRLTAAGVNPFPNPPIDPALAAICTTTRRRSFHAYLVSVVLFLFGGFFAVVAPFLNS